MSWVTILVFGSLFFGINYYKSQHEKRIKAQGKECSQQIHDHYASPGANAYGVLPYETAYTLELEAQKDCILQYPLGY